MDKRQVMPLFDFGAPQVAARWHATDDGIMGGLSQSSLQATSRQTAIFSGSVSLENNGGFASVRSEAGHHDLADCNAIRLRVRGDGHRYKLRIKTAIAHDVFYESGFATRADQWETIDIPFRTLVAKFRGRTVPDAPDFDASRVESIGLMIAEQQAGSFAVEIELIEAVLAG
jgi:NADH dehydrogenase [ubiquinone] 1 alpha subcomplex assembly factor 1